MGEARRLEFARRHDGQTSLVHQTAADNGGDEAGIDEPGDALVATRAQREEATCHARLGRRTAKQCPSSSGRCARPSPVDDHGAPPRDKQHSVHVGKEQRPGS